MDKINGFERNMSKVLGTGGLITNFLGAVACFIANYSSIIQNPLVFLWTVFPILVIWAGNLSMIVVCFKKGRWTWVIYLCVIINGYILFPYMLWNLGPNFLVYYQILTVCGGLSVYKFSQVIPFIPILIISNIVILLSDKINNILIIGLDVVFIFNLVLCSMFYTAFTYERRQLIAKKEELAELIKRDALTGLFNRGTFNKRLEEKYFNCGIMFDIDHFKTFNDTYGHLTGDKTLKMWANILQRHCDDYFVAYRYGGEEFFVLSELSREDSLKRLGEIFEDLRENFVIEGQHVTVSAGMSYIVDNRNNNALIKDADANVYMAKNSGRNRAYLCGECYFACD